VRPCMFPTHMRSHTHRHARKHVHAHTPHDQYNQNACRMMPGPCPIRRVWALRRGNGRGRLVWFVHEFLRDKHAMVGKPLALLLSHVQTRESDTPSGYCSNPHVPTVMIITNKTTPATGEPVSNSVTTNIRPVAGTPGSTLGAFRVITRMKLRTVSVTARPHPRRHRHRSLREQRRRPGLVTSVRNSM
jgi:hypothetical protein